MPTDSSRVVRGDFGVKGVDLMANLRIQTCISNVRPDASLRMAMSVHYIYFHTLPSH